MPVRIRDLLLSQVSPKEHQESSIIIVYAIYQSVGACTDTCSGYAFAILQGHVKSSSCSLKQAELLVFGFLPRSRGVF